MSISRVEKPRVAERTGRPEHEWIATVLLAIVGLFTDTIGLLARSPERAACVRPLSLPPK